MPVKPRSGRPSHLVWMLGAALLCTSCAPRPASADSALSRPSASVARPAEAGPASPAIPHVSLLADADFQAPLDVVFGSGLPAPASVQWRFGDGELGSGTSVHHTFYAPGHYDVEVTMSLAGHQYHAAIPVEVRSSGPERAAAVLLLGDDGLSLALGTQGSVVYAPATPHFMLDGQAVSGARQPLRAGTHSVQVTVQGASGPLERRVSFQSGPVQPRPAYDAEVLRLTNQARAAGWDCTRQASGGPALPPLTGNAQLDAAARAQSSGMALNGYFDHRSAVDGSLPDARIRASGYQPARDAENIAAGQSSPQEVVTAWLHSPGHCANIMGDYREIGVSYVHLDGSRSLDYWTQEFGAGGAGG